MQFIPGQVYTICKKLLKTVLDCKQHCQKWQDRGCVAYVYEVAESKCTLYNSIEHIEYDEEIGTGYESGSKVFGVPGLVTDKILCFVITGTFMIT